MRWWFYDGMMRGLSGPIVMWPLGIGSPADDLQYYPYRFCNIWLSFGLYYRYLPICSAVIFTSKMILCCLILWVVGIHVGMCQDWSVFHFHSISVSIILLIPIFGRYSYLNIQDINIYNTLRISPELMWGHNCARFLMLLVVDLFYGGLSAGLAWVCCLCSASLFRSPPPSLPPHTHCSWWAFAGWMDMVWWDG